MFSSKSIRNCGEQGRIDKFWKIGRGLQQIRLIEYYGNA